MGLSRFTRQKWALPTLIILWCVALNSTYAEAAQKLTAPSPATESGTSASFRIESLDGTSPISINGAGYRGALQFNSDGGLHVFNSLSLEDYVKGISEVPSAWPREALRAQAIAARTYVLWQLQTKSAICPTDSCQVYKGIAKEQAPYGDKWVDAVNSTAGEILQYKGKPILAMYSSSDGGHTSNGSQPYLKGVADPEDAASPLNKWTFTVSLSDLQVQLGLGGSISSVQPQSDGIHFHFSVAGADQEQVVSNGTLRSAINSNNAAPDGRPLAIPSNDFSVSTGSGSLTVSGGGYGHGIGMSQYGAYGKAQKGWTAEAIVANYYGGIKPNHVDGSPTVRVDLGGFSQSDIHIDSPFRILDQNNNVFAVGAGGDWQVSAQGGAISLKSATNVESKISNVHIDATPNKDEAGSVQFDSAVPAVGSLDVVNDAGQVVASQPLTADHLSKSDASGELYRTHDLVPPGTSHTLIPVVSDPGTYHLRIHTDAGPGATSDVSIPFRLARAGVPDVALGDLWSNVEAKNNNRARSPLLGAVVVFSPWIVAFFVFSFLVRVSASSGRSARRRKGRERSQREKQLAETAAAPIGRFSSR